MPENFTFAAVMGAPSTATIMKKSVAVPDSHSNSNSNTNTNNNSSNNNSSCSTYLSLIQQYLAVFQLDNAVWLAERCVAEYPNCEEAVYLQALCYYRSGKPKNARHCLRQQMRSQHASTITTTTTTTTTSSSSTTAMLFLMAQCSLELGDYGPAETYLMNDATASYRQCRDAATISMDEWILQTTVRCVCVFWDGSELLAAFQWACAVAWFFSGGKLTRFVSSPTVLCCNTLSYPVLAYHTAVSRSKWSCGAGIARENMSQIKSSRTRHQMLSHVAAAGPVSVHVVPGTGGTWCERLGRCRYVRWNGHDAKSKFESFLV